MTHEKLCVFTCVRILFDGDDDNEWNIVLEEKVVTAVEVIADKGEITIIIWLIKRREFIII